MARREKPPPERGFRGADDGIRTRDPNLGKVVLYQLSHVRVGRSRYQRSGGADKRAGRVCRPSPNGQEPVLGLANLFLDRLVRVHGVVGTWRGSSAWVEA